MNHQAKLGKASPLVGMSKEFPVKKRAIASAHTAALLSAVGITLCYREYTL